MSVINVDQANKSNVGGSIINPLPIERQQKGISFSRSNDELTHTHKAQLTSGKRVPEMRTSEIIKEDTLNGQFEKKPTIEIENIVIRSTEKSELDLPNRQYIDPDKYIKEQQDIANPDIIMDSNVETEARMFQNFQNTSLMRRNFLSSNQMTYDHMGSSNFSPSERLILAITDDDVPSFKD